MWDERYSADHYIYGTKPNEFLQQNVETIPRGEVLCLAEGEGRNAVFLAKQGYQVSAVDNSLVGIAKARKLAQSEKVSIQFIHANLATFNLGENRWDGIISVFCHLPESIRKPLHQNITTALKPGGIFLLEAYTPKQLEHGTGGPKDASLMMSKPLLTQELGDMHFKHLTELERNIEEGTHHFGIGAVVQAIAEKPNT